MPFLGFDKLWKARVFRNWDFTPVLTVTDRSMIRHLYSGDARLVENDLSVRMKVLAFVSRAIPSSRNLRSCFYSVAWTTMTMQLITLYCHRLAA